MGDVVNTEIDDVLSREPDERQRQLATSVDSGRHSGTMISGKNAGYASQIATSPDGRFTATFGPMEATVKIWDVETARPATGDVSGVVMPLPPTSVAFDREGRRLASAFRAAV